MNTKETYRPANIEFDVNNGVIPLTLGLEFKDMNQAINFVGSKLISFNQKVRANRFIDNFEKNEIRKDYQDLLESKIPMLEKELMKAQSAHAEAKKALADANEYVSATTNEAKALAVEVKRGIREIELDDMYTWSIPVGDKYFFFTFIDSQIKLCKVSDIPFHERSEIFNAMSQNEEFFKKYFPDGLEEHALIEEMKIKLNE
jgi:hypothetical protein